MIIVYFGLRRPFFEMFRKRLVMNIGEWRFREFDDQIVHKRFLGGNPR
jgi:hypothetical protein